MRKSSLVVPFYIFFLLISILTIGGLKPDAAAQSRSTDYFSSGQAVYNPQDRANSRQQAIQDFMAQGVTQAIGSFLSPTQIGTQLAEIQKKILSKAEKYIDSYQIFSEEQTGGEYRVVGQISVSTNALKEDLVKAGLLIAQQKPGVQPASPHDTYNRDESTDRENTQKGQNAEPSAETDDSQNAATESAETPAQPPVSQRTQGPAPGELSESHQPEIEQGARRRGITTTKREILWAVAEKWEQEWVLATDSGDVRSLFTRSLGKEMDDFDFSVLLPQHGSLRIDLAGNIPPSQVISLAEGLGVQDVVVGKVSYGRDRNSRQVLLDASLRVIRIGEGKSEFELHKTQSMEDLSNQGGATELARKIAPQLSSLLGGPQSATGKSGRGGLGAAGESTSGPEASSAQVENAGPLLVCVPSDQYTYWMELESVLRQQFKNMQRAGLEIGPKESSVKLDGVNGDYILKMSGVRLPSGATVRIDSYSTETQTMKVSFAPPEKVQAETK